MKSLDDIISLVRSYHPQMVEDVLWNAYVFTAKYHRPQRRVSGTPFLAHPLEVAYLLAQLRMNESTVAAGLLHDILEDTYVPLEDLREKFSEEVLFLVQGVTKISKIQFSSALERQAENYRKMILAMAKDLRVVIIKLADRLHNMRTLSVMPPEVQKRISRETMEIYVPLANRLGIAWMKRELEDSAFKHLESEAYAELSNRAMESVREQEEYISGIQGLVSTKLKSEGIQARVEGRAKHLYGIFLKMKKQDIDFGQVFDILGIRVITDTVRDCYSILGFIHSLWKPVPGRIKDYIALPKPNLYQSLHTTVIGPLGKRVEFQIRTEEMHKVCEEGVAAHWRYKEGISEHGKEDGKFVWIRHLLESQQDLLDPKEFLTAVKTELFPDEVYVFTPKGDVVSLPTESTPVDLAYAIHSKIGEQCSGARVNGRMVPLKYTLRNGDTVEIITNANHRPSRDWLKYVRTPRARSRILAHVKAEQKERSLSLGHELLDKELAKYELSLERLRKEGRLDDLAQRSGYATGEVLIRAVGNGRVSAQKVARKALPESYWEEEKRREIEAQLAGKPAGGERGGTAVTLLDIDDDNILVHHAKCCNPLPGDAIVGFITRGRGLSIHRKNCPTLGENELNQDRLVQVEWSEGRREPHAVRISVEVLDKPGRLAKITSTMAGLDVNVREGRVITTGGIAFNDFSIDIFDLAHLEKVIKALETLEGVIKVERVDVSPRVSRKHHPSSSRG